ncbi:uncharacterized protein RCC_02458 [Ramularia collo-cygni]|uniref:NAD(P)-binding domain-containing protein n=1 Tax=Ramularia collo-cygni TaxID=112498 RepID=A0A2D3V2B3_9PEZI|nr:uncharacterized protein RCC_02458 [Ramularia collo-cygni]CZT16624.1 uncharacterized protein RCC_02458 [Ramularia collo-cygni]
MHDILILGAGWTSTFLLPLLHKHSLSFAATTRNGRKVAGFPTLQWAFDPNNTDKSHYKALPAAKHILITFPLTGPGQSAHLIHNYQKIHGPHSHFIQLGSTGIWQISQPTCWTTRKSAYDTTNNRAIAEDELLRLGGCVLNLAGLWGGERDPRNWVGRVAKDKAGVKGKKSVHLVHGEDVARGILAVVMHAWKGVSEGQRWMLTDGFVYDWWALFAKWADDNQEGKQGPTEQSRWVYELMGEEGVGALPRDMQTLGRCYDSREFWATYGISPLKAGV